MATKLKFLRQSVLNLRTKTGRTDGQTAPFHNTALQGGLYAVTYSQDLLGTLLISPSDEAQTI